MSTNLTKINQLLYDFAQESDDPTFRKMFTYLSNPVWRFVMGFVKSAEVAEEITGDVFYQLWKNRDKLRDIQNIKCYVFTIARNLAVNYLKKQSGRKEICLDEVDDEGSSFYGSSGRVYPEWECLLREETRFFSGRI